MVNMYTVPAQTMTAFLGIFLVQCQDRPSSDPIHLISPSLFACRRLQRGKAGEVSLHEESLGIIGN